MLVISSDRLQLLAEVPVNSGIIKTDMGSSDFVAYLESNINFIKDSMVFD
jgi:hypothetical protein